MDQSLNEQADATRKSTRTLSEPPVIALDGNLENTPRVNLPYSGMNDKTPKHGSSRSFQDIMESQHKKNRPEDTDWSQQRLKIWQPMLTPPWAIRVTLCVGLIFLSVGLVITIQSTNLDVYRIVYDSPSSEEDTSDGVIIEASKCRLNEQNDANSFSADHTCKIQIILKNDVSKKLQIFYELGNYYQNHRRFATSWVANQYIDNWLPGESVSSCEPLVNADSETCTIGSCSTKKSRQLFPCGIVANSMFNDIFWLEAGELPDGTILGRKDLIQTGIARNYASNSIKNPSFELDANEFLPIWNNPNLSLIIPPPQRSSPAVVTADYNKNTAWTTEPPGNGLENEHWRVWVEIAATSRFRKPYGRIEGDLPKGTKLTFAVQSNFFVRSFDGTKALVIARTAWFGSENIELGIFYIVVGIVCLIAGAMFLWRNKTNPRKPGDASYMRWKEKKQ